MAPRVPNPMDIRPGLTGPLPVPGVPDVSNLQPAGAIAPGLERAASGTFDILLRRQRDYEQSEIDKAAIAANKADTDIRTTIERDYQGGRAATIKPNEHELLPAGGTAADVAVAMQEKFIKENILPGLPSDRARREFERQYIPHQVALRRDMAKYVEGERQRDLEETYKVKVHNSKMTGAAAYENPATVQLHEDEIAQAVLAEAGRNDWNFDKYTAELESHLAEYHSLVAKALLGAHDPVAAQAYIESAATPSPNNKTGLVKNMLTPDVRATVERDILIERNKFETVELVASVSKMPTLAQRIKTIEDQTPLRNPDGSPNVRNAMLRDDAVKQARSDWYIDESIRRNDNNSKIVAIQDKILANGGVLDKTWSEFRELDADARPAALNFANKIQSEQRGQTVRDKAEAIANSAAVRHSVLTMSPEQVLGLNIRAEMGDVLTNSDLRACLEYQENIKKDQSGPALNGTSAGEAAAVRAKGIGLDTEETARVKAYVQTEVWKLAADLKQGEKVPAKEVERIIGEALTLGSVASSLFGIDWISPDTQSYRYEHPPGETPEGWTPYPPEEQTYKPPTTPMTPATPGAPAREGYKPDGTRVRAERWEDLPGWYRAAYEAWIKKTDPKTPKSEYQIVATYSWNEEPTWEPPL